MAEKSEKKSEKKEETTKSAPAKEAPTTSAGLMVNKSERDASAK